MKIGNVLSLFDGISCGQVALNRSGIQYDNYFASEIDKHAMKVTMKNFPNTIQLGSVADVKAESLPKIDLLIGGSPCQSFSFAGKRKGMSTKDEQEILTLEQYLKLKSDCFEFEGQSYLFWEYMRLLKELKPKYFLLENVYMEEKWERVLSFTIGVKPLRINSNLVSAQNRKRLYWTNIGMIEGGLFGEKESIIEQPKDKKIFLKDILESNVDEKYYLSEKQLAYISRDDAREVSIDGEKAQCQMARQYASWQGQFVSQEIKGCDYRTDEGFRIKKDGKSGTLQARAREDESCSQMAMIGKSIRRLTPIECERLQTLPTNEIILEIDLCLEEAKNYVIAVNKNPKLQKLVSIVEKLELVDFVDFVKKYMLANHQLIKLIVQKNVGIKTQNQINLCTNLKKEESKVIVSNAGNHLNLQNQEKMQDSAQRYAFTNTTQEKILLIGEEELPQKDNHCINQMNGGNPLKLYGKEIMQIAGCVEKNLITIMGSNSTYIILSRLGIENLEQILIIYYWYAKNATDGYIANQTSIKNILMIFRIPYTSGISGSQRYKSIGNGWTVDVISHIFNYLKG